MENIDVAAPLGRSDHSIISFDFICRAEHSRDKVMLNYQKADYVKMINMMDKDWEHLFSECTQDVDQQWNIFQNLYNEATEACIPKKKFRTSQKKTCHTFRQENTNQKEKKI